MGFRLFRFKLECFLTVGIFNLLLTSFRWQTSSPNVNDVFFLLGHFLVSIMDLWLNAELMIFLFLSLYVEWGCVCNWMFLTVLLIFQLLYLSLYTLIIIQGSSGHCTRNLSLNSGWTTWISLIQRKQDTKKFRSQYFLFGWKLNLLM